MDGKNFEFGSRFTFQQVDLDTSIIEFNDVKNNFDFEKLFSVLTDDMTLEYKNKHPFKIKFEESPKILISTNYTIKGTGSSFEDRMLLIEFSDYYNQYHRPKDDFGCMFFDEWDETEWNKFDNFMMNCLWFFLQNGLVKQEPINIEMKKLIAETAEEFIVYAERNITLNVEYDKKTGLYQPFKSKHFDEVDVTPRTFNKWLRLYGSYKGYESKEREANGQGYIRFVLPAKNNPVEVGDNFELGF